MNKKFIMQVVFISMAITAVRSMTGCSRSDEQATQHSESSAPAPAPFSEAAAAEPAAPEPPPEPEKISVWAGECYGFAGTKLWFGKATDINMGDRSYFNDELNYKKVELYGQHNCVWRYDLDRNKRDGE